MDTNDKQQPSWLTRVIDIVILRHVTISRKLIIGYGFLILATLISTGATLAITENLADNINFSYEVRAPAAYAANQAEVQLVQALVSFEDYLLNRDRSAGLAFDAHRKSLQVHLTELREVSGQLSSAEQQLIADVEQVFAEWQAILAAAGDTSLLSDQAAAEVWTEVRPLTRQMKTLLTRLTFQQYQRLRAELATEQTQIDVSRYNAMFVGALTFFFGIFLSIRFHQTIITPIKHLTETATRLAEGDRTVRANITSQDEMGALAQAFNAMAAQLNDLVDTLEDRVRQRTLALETSAEISRQISAIIDLDEMLQDIVNRLKAEFNLYHTHIYLVDEETGDLIMAKGSGEVGQKLAKEEHRIPSGYGIVGTVAYSNQHFLSNNVAESINFIHNPYLPNTQSELALPLHKGDRVLGVLDIQSEQRDFFSQDYVNLMQSIADQIAVAIDNANLYNDLEESLIHQYEVTTSYSRFVPREILFLLGKREITEVHLGDQIQQQMTILFADIRSFTSLSEQMNPEENFQFINAYLGRVSPIIRQHQGFIDKYIGDAIMALFPRSADDAVQAAIAIQQEVAKYNTIRLDQDKPPIRIGIGLHTGNVMLGTVGEEARMEGTVISDSVNLAARMEGLTKTYRASVVISEEILSDLGELSSRYTTRFLDRVKVKGKQTPVSVFEILDAEPKDTVTLKLITRPDFEMGLFHYQYREFEQAKPYFAQVLAVHPEDDAAALYLQRIKYFMEYGVPVDWEGVVSIS